MATLTKILTCKINVSPEDFLATWIFKLYKVEPENDKQKYRKACIIELHRLCPEIQRETIRTKWLTKGEYPAILNSLLELANRNYAAIEALGHLPDHSSDIEK
jgi:hypothetical protein